MTATAAAETGHVDPRQLIADQRDLIEVEATHPYDHLCPHMVPGPMQTPAYARAVLTSRGVFTPAQVEEALWIRMERVKVLCNSSAQRRFLLSRDGLDKPFVSADALAAQHDQIAHLARLGHIQVRVLDPGAAHLTPYLLRGNRVYMEPPTGLKALPDEQYGAYDAHFSDLWDGAAPYAA